MRIMEMQAQFQRETQELKLEFQRETQEMKLEIEQMRVDREAKKPDPVKPAAKKEG
jgi:hypothetical protein